MVVRQHHQLAFLLQCILHQPAHVYRHTAGGAFGHHSTGHETEPVIQTRQPQLLLRFSQVNILEVGTGGVKGVQGQILPGAEPVLPGQLGDESQQHGTAFSHTLYIPQGVIVCIQHICQRAEPLQKPMRNLVGIYPGQGVEQGQLQHFMLLEALQSLLQKFSPHPIPVSAVQALFRRFLAHIRSPFCIRMLLLYRISLSCERCFYKKSVQRICHRKKCMQID